ncbi:MAG: hypothetical protein SF051_14905 [Elusimicrobiota bacterium]|nr:hypothetical protein [Elusimicrobiota bacterium]
MKTIPLALVLALTAASAHADGPALAQAQALADGAPAAAVIDGQRQAAPVVAAAGAPGDGARVVTTGARGNITINGRTPAAPARAAEPSEPGFFAKTWAAVKKPSFLVPAGMALAMGAAGAMIAGPLGAITGALIGGLFGFIFTKAMG